MEKKSVENKRLWTGKQEEIEEGETSLSEQRTILDFDERRYQMKR